MSIKGFQIGSGAVQKYDYESLDNIPESFVDVDSTLTQAGDAADAKAVGDAVSSLTSAISQGSGLTENAKQAILTLAQKVAYIDGQGADYYQTLYEALYPPVHVTSLSVFPSSLSFSTINSVQQLTATVLPADATDVVEWESSDTSVATVDETGHVTSKAYGNCTITCSAGNREVSVGVVVAQATLQSISAVYTQSGTVYDNASLNSLTGSLVVTAAWSNSTTSVVPSSEYTLSGTLSTGTSTITVSYGGKTASFTVTVTHKEMETLTVTWYKGNWDAAIAHENNASRSYNTRDYTGLLDGTDGNIHLTLPVDTNNTYVTAGVTQTSGFCVLAFDSSGEHVGYIDVTTGEFVDSKEGVYQTLVFGQEYVLNQGYMVEFYVKSSGEWSSNSKRQNYLRNMVTSVTKE